jgi:ankyrin repeat protein
MKRTIEAADCMLNEENACKWLALNGFDRHNLTNHKGKWRCTAMTTACYQGNLDLCKFLLRNSDVSTLRTKEKDEQTPMHKACRMGHLDVAMWLFENGAKDDIQSVDHQGSTPMHLACHGGHFKTVEWIVQKTHQISNFRLVNNIGESFLALACQSANVELCGFLIKLGACNNANTGHLDHDLVHRAHINIKWTLLDWCNHCLLKYYMFKSCFLLGTLSFSQSPILGKLSGFNDVVRMVGEYSGIVYGRELRNVRELKNMLDEETSGQFFMESDDDDEEENNQGD